MSLFSHAAIYALFVMNPAGVIHNPPADQQAAAYIFREEEKQRTYESIEDCQKDLKKAETEWTESVHDAFARLGNIREDDVAFQTQQARIDSLSCEKIDDIKTANNNRDIAKRVRDQLKAEQPAPAPAQTQRKPEPVMQAMPEQYIEPTDEVDVQPTAPAPSPMAIKPPTYRGMSMTPTKAFFMAENGRKLDGTFGWVKYATAYPSPASCWSAVKQIIKDDEARLQQAFSTMRPDYSAMSWYQTKMVELQTRKRSLSCVTE